MSGDGGRQPLGQPLLRVDDPSYIRHVAQLFQKITLVLLKQAHRVSEERRYDAQLRAKVDTTFVFSMVGMLTMVFLDAIPHAHGFEAAVNGPSIWEQGDFWARSYILPLQAILTLTSIVCIVLICQTYAMVLDDKRAQWLMRDAMTTADNYSVGIAAAGVRGGKPVARDDVALRESYSFLASTYLTVGLLLEVLVHLWHPIVFLSHNSELYEIAKIVTFFRIYLGFKVVHFRTVAYRDRHEITQHYQGAADGCDIKIDSNFTLTLWIQRHVGAVVAAWTLLTCFVGGGLMFFVERNAEPLGENETWAPDPIDWAGDFTTAVWFAFVTATTIGYGDYWPISFRGRVMAVVIAMSGFFLTIIFQAQLTNQLKPSRQERYIVNYLTARKMGPQYEDRAAKVIQAFWRMRRYGTPREVFHKHNIMRDSIGAFKQFRWDMRESAAATQSQDVVLEARFEELTEQANALGLAIQDQRSDLLAMHKRLYNTLRKVKGMVMDYQRNGGVPGGGGARAASPPPQPPQHRQHRPYRPQGRHAVL